MTRIITMTAPDGRKGSITVERQAAGNVIISFRRPETVSVGVRLTTSQARLLIEALQLELAAPVGAAVRDVLAERWRQIEVEGWSAEHDSQYGQHELEKAAASYALTSARKFGLAQSVWPFSGKWWKPHTPRRDLVKAGALILAAIERLDRASEDETAL